MAIDSGYIKFKKYLKQDSGNYILTSIYTSSNTVHFDDGKTAQTKLGAINGITASLTSTSTDIALSASAGKSINDKVATNTSVISSHTTSINNLNNSVTNINNNLGTKITAQLSGEILVLTI